MPKLRHAFAFLILCSLVGCKHKTSPFCPKDMSPVAARSVPGTSLWCESSNKLRARWIEWHKGTTKLRQSCSYYKGVAQGSFTAWHPNGKLWVQGQFINGQQAGKWKQWDGNGNEVAEGDYRSGRLVAGAPVAGMAGCLKAGRPPAGKR